MDDGLKQRLVGALVLIALAVIFLPSLFQRDSRAPIDTTSLIPEPPHIEPVIAPEPQRPEGFDPAPKPRQAYQPPVESEPANEPVPSVETPSTPKPKPKPAASTVKEPVKPGLDARGTPSGWVVQVASFQAPERAKALTSKLLAASYRAYMREFSTNKGKVSRVFVGPMVDKQQALEAKKSLDKAYAVDGLVLRFTAK